MTAPLTPAEIAELRHRIDNCLAFTRNHPRIHPLGISVEIGRLGLILAAHEESQRLCTSLGTAHLDDARFGLAQLIDERDALKAKLAACEKERDHWKANHDNQVKIKAAVTDRPDLDDRAKRVMAIITERDAALARVAQLEAAAKVADDFLTDLGIGTGVRNTLRAALSVTGREVADG